MGFIKLVVDGSCLKQGGVGGWAYRFEYGGLVYKDSGGLYPVTNNVAELEAVRHGLDNVDRVVRRHAGRAGLASRLLVISDSRYVIRGMTEWIALWRRRQWTTLEGKPVSNRPLWEDIDRLASKFGDVRWKWVKGHQGHELNEIVDEMARDAARVMQRDRAL